MTAQPQPPSSPPTYLTYQDVLDRADRQYLIDLANERRNADRQAATLSQTKRIPSQNVRRTGISQHPDFIARYGDMTVTRCPVGIANCVTGRVAW